MKLKKLRRKIRRQAKRELRAGRMTQQQSDQCEVVANNDLALQMLNERIENEVNPWNRANGLIGASWKGWFSNAWDWFVANWPKILNIILKLAPLLLLEPDREDSQPLAEPAPRPLQRQQRRMHRVMRRGPGDRSP